MPKNVDGKNMGGDIVNLSEINLSDKIYTIRDQKIMLDVDLAEIYGYETKYLNRQVFRNKEKFEGEDFMFRLTKEEVNFYLRCHFGTLDSGRGKHTKYLPYAFTEQGIYMLMTVLKGELATKQSRTLVRLFKNMKEYIINPQSLSKSPILSMIDLSYWTTIGYIVLAFPLRILVINLV